MEWRGWKTLKKKAAGYKRREGFQGDLVMLILEFLETLIFQRPECSLSSETVAGGSE